MSDLLDLHEDAPLRRALFLSAILLFFVPFVQAGSTIWPLKLSNIQWRFGAANALSAVLLLPFLSLSLILFMSRLLESRSLARLVGITSGVLTVGLAASFVVFLLDALQLKTIVSTQAEEAFKGAAARVAIVSVMFTVAFLMLSLAGLKAPRGSAARSTRRVTTTGADDTNDASPGLIVGQ